MDSRFREKNYIQTGPINLTAVTFLPEYLKGEANNIGDDRKDLIICWTYTISNYYGLNRNVEAIAAC